MTWAWLLALAAGWAAVQVSTQASRMLPPPRSLDELSYYPSGKHLRPATLGHAESAADLAWLRAVQYYGEHRHTDNRFTRMEHVFEILTALSPRYEAAYVFGAFALAQEGQNFAAAERLILRGIEANPRSGWLAFEAGFLYYVKPGGRDLARAAEYFEQSARQPDAPPQAARFAAFARQASGELEMAFALWQGVLQTSSNPYLREMAEREMKKIQAAFEAHRRDQAVQKLAVPRVQVQGGP
jgi:hypothetical protein